MLLYSFKVQWLLYKLLILTPNTLYSVQTAGLFPRLSEQTATVSLHSLTFRHCISLDGVFTGSYKECVFIGQEVNFVLQMMKQVPKRSKT